MPEHTIDPVYNKESRVLILGTFPSVKSREAQFFYGHPQNRFWKVLAALFDEPIPQSIEEKKDLALKHHIAIWDVIASCTITGSADSTIKDVVPNDLEEILNTAHISHIYVNGAKAEQLYKKYLYPKTHIQAVKLPSTSPANAAWSLDKLIQAWSCILKDIDLENPEDPDSSRAVTSGEK